MSSNPYDSYQNGSTPANYAGTNVGIFQPLMDASGWIKLTGWIFIILGVIYCISIIGILVGWLPIWIGIVLKRAGDNLSHAKQVNDLNLFYAANKDLGLYFTITGILFLIGIVLNILGLSIMLLVTIIGAANAPAAGL